MNKDAILFPLHHAYDIEGRVNLKDGNMFAEVKALKRIYDEIESDKVNILRQEDMTDAPMPEEGEGKDDRYNFANIIYKIGIPILEQAPRAMRRLQPVEAPNQNSKEENSMQHEPITPLVEFPGLVSRKGFKTDAMKSLSLVKRYLGEEKLPDVTPERTMFALTAISKMFKQTQEKDFELVKEEHLKDLQAIVDSYHIEDSQLLRALKNCLNRTDSLKCTLIKNLNNIPPEELKNQAQYRLKLPIKHHFRVTMFNNLKHYPDYTIHYYYGGKLALYFGFMNFYRDGLLPISVIGLGMMAVLMVFLVRSPGISAVEETTDPFMRLYFALHISYSILIVVWMKWFQLEWSLYEKEFQVKFGGKSQEFQKRSIEDIRPGFIGVRKRDVVTDNVNNREENDKKTYWNMALLIFVFLLMVAAAGACSYFILINKRESYKYGWISNEPYNPASTRDYTLETYDVPTHEDEIDETLSGLNADYEDSFPARGDPYSVNGTLYKTDPIYNSLDTLSKITQTYVDPDELTWNLLEVIRIYFFQIVFKSMLRQLVNRLNLKYKSDHEDTLILFISLFQILNVFWIFIIVASQSIFLGNSLLVTSEEGNYFVSISVCIEEDCNRELSTFVLMYCVFKLVFVIGIKAIFIKVTSIIVSRAKKIVDEAAKGLTKSSTSIHQKSQKFGTGDKNFKDKTSDMTNAEKIKFIIKAFYYSTDATHELTDIPQDQPHDKPLVKTSVYRKIDQEIDRQVVDLKAENKSSDYDPILDNYIQLFESLGTSAIFGVIFPLVYVTAWLTCFVEFILNRNKVLYESRRNLPVSASSIGLWNEILVVFSLLTILANSIYVSFIMLANRPVLTRLATFIVMIAALFVLYTVFESVYLNFKGGMANLLSRRSEFIRARLFGGSEEATLKTDKLKVDVSSKVFNEVQFKARVTDLKELVKSDEEEGFDEKEEVKDALNFIKKENEQYQLYKASMPSMFAVNDTKQSDSHRHLRISSNAHDLASPLEHPRKESFPNIEESRSFHVNPILIQNAGDTQEPGVDISERR